MTEFGTDSILPKLIRLLFAEDDSYDAKIVNEMLREAGGFRVHHVGLLADALERLQSVDVDAILLDLRLPDAPGLEALEAVRRTAPGVPVVVYSGLVDEELAAEVLRQGAQDCLLKGDVDRALLARSIQYAIGRSRVERNRQSIEDPLTCLPSRVLLEDRIKQGIALARRSGQWLGVLKIGLEAPGGARIAFAEDSGEQLLKGVAQRFCGCVRESDTLSRASAGQFVVVAPGVSNQEEAVAIANRLLDSLVPPFRFNGDAVRMTGRVGISLYPHDGETSGALLKAADVALTRVPDDPESRLQFFLPARTASSADGRRLGRALQQALDDGELRLHYQPRVDGRSGTLGAVQALVCWNHPGGWMPAAKFLPVAEETDLIVPIGEWMLRAACRQNRAWQAQGLKAIPVAVELSPRLLLADDLVETVTRVLDETTLCPEHLELAISEGAILLNEGRAQANLNRLHDLGVRVALDDFGLGSLSPAHLRRLPVDGAKISAALVSDIDSDRRATEFVSGLISLAHGLGCRVTAEGVETADHVDFLRDRDCDQLQGFYFHEPGPAESMVALFDTEFLDQSAVMA